MKKVQKRILTVIVSLTITGSGIATYLRYSGNSFDPEKYTRNSAWNRNQITFDDDQTDDEYMNSEKQDDTTEDSRQLEQDDNADQAQTPSEQRDNAILFESQTPQNLNVPALITQDTDGGSGDGAAVSLQQASQNVTSYLVGDRSGSASGPVAVIPSASGSGTVISGGTSGNSGTAGKSDQNGKGNAGGTSGGGNSSGGSQNNGGGQTDTPGTDTQPEQPAAPSYDNNYTEKTPEQPSDIYENLLIPVRPMPEEGLENADSAKVPELMVNPLNETFDADMIYYGEELDAWKLLCACNVHVKYNGTYYRITSLNDNFKITGYPQKAEKDFTASFAFRLNADSDWVRKDVSFEVYPYKTVLSDYNHADFINPKSDQYPAENESVDLLNYYGKMYHSDHSFPKLGESIRQIFLGWSENNGGDPVYYRYTPTKKGLNILYPLGTAELPKEFTAEISSMWSEDDHYYFIQTLTGYTGSSRDLEIPAGLQKVALEADVDRVSVPASVLEITSTLKVKDSYDVSEKNPALTSRDGVLYNKACTELYAVPYAKTEITVPETVKKVTFPEENQIQSLTFQSAEPPEIELRRLDHAKIYVPDDAYFDYLKKWAMRLGTNQLVPQSDKNPTDFYTQDDAILLNTENGTVLYGLTEQVAGTYAVPEGVTEIRKGAFEGRDLKALILPASLQTLDSGAFNGLDGTQIYFQGETAPAAQADSFSENIGGLHIPAFSMEFDTEQWNTYDIPIAAEAYAICETDGNVYFQEQDGATLLTAAPDTVHFSAESLPGVSIKTIGSRAFRNCSGLMTAELPEETKEIQQNAFSGCSALESVVSLSEDELTIGDGAFDNCMMLYCVACNAASAVMEGNYAPGNNSFFYRPYDSYGYAGCFAEFTYRYRMETGADGVAGVYGSSGEESYLLSVSGNLNGTYTLAPNTVEIASGAFSRCQNAFFIAPESFASVMFVDDAAFQNSGISGELTFSDAFSLLGSNAFQDCSNLTAVHFETGSTLRSIPSNAFAGCTALSEVTFGANSCVESIHDGAFAETALHSFTFPETTNEVYYNIFGGCDALEEIRFAGETPPNLIGYGQGSDFVFQSKSDGSVNTVPLAVPDGCRETYAAAWQYPYAGFSDLESLCSEYYAESAGDGTSIEEIAQEITDTFLPKWQTLWDLLGCSETAPEPDREEVLEKLKQAEENMRQW